MALEARIDGTLYGKLLKMCEDLHDCEHSKDSKCFDLLSLKGSTISNLGRYLEALELYRQALKGHQDAFGKEGVRNTQPGENFTKPSAPDTANFTEDVHFRQGKSELLRGIAKVYSRQGGYKKARNGLKGGKHSSGRLWRRERPSFC